MQPTDILERAGVPRELARATAGYFASADLWENSGLRIGADSRTVYFSSAEAREKGNKPTNYTIEILMFPGGRKEKRPEPLPAPESRNDPKEDEDDGPFPDLWP